MTTKEPSILDDKPPRSAGVLPFEADRYRSYVDDFEMTEAQKQAFLRALWDIMSTFVRLGFGVESVLPALLQRASEMPPDALEETVPTHAFNVAVDDGTPEKKEKKEE